MKLLTFVSSIILSVGVALLACFLEGLMPVHIIGAAVIAMFMTCGQRT